MQQALFGRMLIEPEVIRMLLFGLALVLMMLFRPGRHPAVGAAQARARGGPAGRGGPMSAAGTSQGANRAPSGGSAAAELANEPQRGGRT